MTNTDTRKDTRIPMSKRRSSKGAGVKPARTSFKTLRSDAPSMTGIARKKENSADAVRDTPVSIPPRIVEPEREVPGISEST